MRSYSTPVTSSVNGGVHDTIIKASLTDTLKSDTASGGPERNK